MVKFSVGTHRETINNANKAHKQAKEQKAEIESAFKSGNNSLNQELFAGGRIKISAEAVNDDARAGLDNQPDGVNPVCERGKHITASTNYLKHNEII